MSVDRVATSQQTAYLLNQINAAGARLDQTNKQIASGTVADTYAGFGDQAQVLQAAISAHARNDAYASATGLATTQVDMQDTQLTTLSGLAAQLKKAVSDAIANNDPATLMSQVDGIFTQAVSILNSKDANGDYLYSGGRTDTAPVTVGSLAQLTAAPSVASVFVNGDARKAVQVADSQTVSIGLTASDIGTGLMQALKDIASFDGTPAGNFDNSPNLSAAQSSFLTGQIATAGTVATGLTAVTAHNGNVYNQLQNVSGQQDSMATLYSGFIDKLQNTNMADAATQLSLNQTALEAALHVTASLNQLSLLNFLPIK
jgi:flagellar hook-associated protein 3 FlgL